MMKTKKLILNMCLFLIAVFVALALGEIAARIYNSFFGYKLYNVVPAKSISFLPNSQALYKTQEFEFILKTNSFGRRDREWSQNTLADPESVLLIGDSMVLGYGLKEDQTIPDLLEQFFRTAGREKEVFNFGMPGDISIAQYEQMLNEALKSGINARTVILAIFLGNDFNDPEKTNSHKSLISRCVIYQLIKHRLASSPAITGYILRTGNMLHIDTYDSPESFIFKKNPTPAQNDLFYSILSRLNNIQAICKDNGRNLYVVIVPTKLQVENRRDLNSADYNASIPNEKILQFCNQNRLRCLDLYPIFVSYSEEKKGILFFPMDRHLNQLGARIAAHAIYDNLKKYAGKND
jgi:hypothetical protein